jgi:16S rRNA (cytidine1402-2'-O)-methyltransferase
VRSLFFCQSDILAGMGTLYLVGTPIGNLEDVSQRALRTLREVSLIAAEDTRVTGYLLKHFDIETPLTSYHEHNKQEKLPMLLARLSEQDIALVSDAGMPGLSDPGYELVRAAVDQKVTVVPVPGPSAVITALVVSGLPSDEFTYLGFLPRRRSARRTALEHIAHETRTLICYETPHRLLAALADIDEILGARPMAVARELTKLYEDVQRGTPAGLIDHFSQEPPKGEITLVIGGARPEEISWSDEAIVAEIGKRLAEGDSLSAAARKVAEISGRPRREVYELGLGARE